MITKNLTNKLLKVILTTLILVSSAISCSTASYNTYDYDYSIMDIQKAVAENLPQGLGRTNENRRIFYSKKFTVNQAKKGAIPLVMRVAIQGDRRPYGLAVDVRRVAPNIANYEEAFNYGTEFEGGVSLAKRVVTRIEDQLAQRRKSKNIFDDFRPF